MEDANTVPALESITPVKPLFRAGTSSNVVMTVALAIKGDYNHKDLVNAVKDYATKNSVDAGVVDRNARYVVAKLLKLGKLTKVKRGRWIVAS
jgi:hypothetical protein